MQPLSPGARSIEPKTGAKTPPAGQVPTGGLGCGWPPILV